MPTTPRPEKALYDLLCELFSVDELLRFVTNTYGKQLARELPGAGARLSALAFETSGLLDRRGLVRADLFDALAVAVPDQRDTIAVAAEVWGFALRPVEVKPEPEPEPASDPAGESDPAKGSAAPNSWHVFVSYAHADQEWVRLLVDNLHRLGLDVFYDEWEITAGTVVSARIDQGLSRSGAGVVVVSKASVERLWVQEEYVALLKRATEAGMSLIPVLLEEAKMPSMLSSRRWVDFQGKRGDKYVDAVKELAAAIRGEPKKRPRRGEPLRTP